MKDSDMKTTKRQLEELIKEVVLSAMEEGKFDPKTMKDRNFMTLMDAIRYIEKDVGLRKLGQGSARIVFALDSKRALKMARNQRGLAQNQAELDVMTDPAAQNVFARIFSYDPSPDCKWLVSELVRPLGEEETQEFKRLTGVPWHVFSDLVLFDKRTWKDSLSSFVGEFSKQEIRSWEQGWLGSVFETLNSIKPVLIEGDLDVIGHWGKTPDQRIVLLDYGYTESVMNRFY